MVHTSVARSSRVDIQAVRLSIPSASLFGQQTIPRGLSTTTKISFWKDRLNSGGTAVLWLSFESLELPDHATVK